MVAQRIYSPRPHYSGTHTYLAESTVVETEPVIVAPLSRRA